MIERELTICNRLGLHARAAAQFVKLASQYAADIQVGLDGVEVNGKSIMGLMMLAAGQGSRIRLRADGPDEQEAVAAIARLVEARFGEED